MLLKCNISNIKTNRRLLDVNISKSTVSRKDGYTILTLYTNTPHKLNVGDLILISNNNSTIDVKNSDISKVSFDRFNENTFSVCIKNRRNLYIKEIVYGDDDVNFAYIEGVIPKYVNGGSELILYKKTYKYVVYNGNTQDILKSKSFISVDYNPFGSVEYVGCEYVLFNGVLYNWSYEETAITVTMFSENYFSFDINDNLNENDVIEVNDDRFVVNNIIKSDILFYEYYEYLNINLPLKNNVLNDLNDSDVRKFYFNEKKESLITDIKDYEKRCFTPYYNNQGKFLTVNKINFNLFFRERDKTEWSTNDSKGWNQLPSNNGTIPSKVQSYYNGDLLGNLNFTDEDVFYRKKKLSKSFLRLSFYSSNKPLNNMLLFYSTIFFDSGELFSKYLKSINKKTTTLQLVDNNELGENRLSASFSVTDRYNKNKSSEGFYLYLFPDGVNSVSRKIYMKAEFNHAGYGKTVPLFYPVLNNNILNFTNENFPKSIVDSSNYELSKYYEYSYIPLTIAYDENKNDYIYYFDYASYNENELTLNLYEPKINSLN